MLITKYGFKICQAVQQPGKTVDQFVIRLQKLAVTCKLGDVATWWSFRTASPNGYDDMCYENTHLLTKALSLEASEMEFKKNFQ